MGFNLIGGIGDKVGGLVSSATDALESIGAEIATSLGFETGGEPDSKVFLADYYINNPFSKVKIIFNKQVLASGIFMNEFSMSASNEWSNPFDWGLSQTISDIANYSKFLGAKTGAAEGVGQDSKSFTWNSYMSPTQTLLGWSGPQAPGFTFDILLLTLRPGDNIPKMVGNLYSTVMPTPAKFIDVQTTDKKGGKEIGKKKDGSPDFGKNEFKAGEVYGPPLGYFPGFYGKGTFTVQIGDWFYGTSMVMENVSVTFSPEVTNKQQPIFAKVSIQFRPNFSPKFDEFIAWFPIIQKQTTGKDTTAGQRAKSPTFNTNPGKQHGSKLKKNSSKNSRLPPTPGR